MEIVSTRKENPLVVWDVPLIPIQLMKSEREIVALATVSEENPKIKDADMLTLAEKISNITRIRLGLKPRSDADEQVFLLTLEADINKFPQLTIAEIEKALTMGLDGEFDPDDKDIFFSSSKFVRWIRAYIEHTKKPVMSKHAQFIHQLKEPVVTLSDEEKVKSACDVANMYARARRKDPESIAVGAAVLWQNLEALEIHTMPHADKMAMKEEFEKIYPQATPAEIVILCQNAAYNRFIGDLVEWDRMLSDEGKIIEIEC